MTDLFNELVVVDEALMLEEVKNLAARVIANDAPVDRVEEIMREARSWEYALMVAEQAAHLVVVHLMDRNSLPVTVLPVVGSRLSTFIHRARTRIAVFSPPVPPEVFADPFPLDDSF